MRQKLSVGDYTRRSEASRVVDVPAYKDDTPGLMKDAMRNGYRPLVQTLTVAITTLNIIVIVRHSINAIVPSYDLATVGRRAFPVSAANLWNSLPAYLTSAPSLTVIPVAS